MTKSKAIKLYCRECSGGSPKEVVLCHLYDCPLWPWRTGTCVESRAYKKRMEGALKRYAAEVRELACGGIDTSRFMGISNGKKAVILEDAADSLSSEGLGSNLSKKRQIPSLLRKKLNRFKGAHGLQAYAKNQIGEDAGGKKCLS